MPDPNRTLAREARSDLKRVQGHIEAWAEVAKHQQESFLAEEQEIQIWLAFLATGIRWEQWGPDHWESARAFAWKRHGRDRQCRLFARRAPGNGLWYGGAFSPGRTFKSLLEAMKWAEGLVKYLQTSYEASAYIERESK